MSIFGIEVICRNIFSFLPAWEDKVNFGAVNRHLRNLWSALHTQPTLYFCRQIELRDGQILENLPIHCLKSITSVYLVFETKHISRQCIRQFSRLLPRLTSLQAVYSDNDVEERKIRVANRCLAPHGLEVRKVSAANSQKCINERDRDTTPPAQITTEDQIINGGSDTAFKHLLQDIFITPPSVRSKIEQYKERLLIEYSGNGPMITRKRKRANLFSYIPASLQRVIDCSSYVPLDANLDAEFLSLRHEMQLSNINSRIETVVKPLVESILISTNYWILVTQFEVYLPHHQLDDCARNERPFTYHRKPCALIQNRQEGKQTWQELVIRWGNVELLCTGGIISTCGDYLVQMETFLGPTLQLKKLTLFSNDAFSILVRDDLPRIQKDYRILRDLSKYGATYLWSFCSSRFAENHFFAVNACNFHRHPARNSKNRDVAWLSSFLVEKCLQDAMTGEEIEMVRSGIAQARKMKISSSSLKNDIPVIESVLNTLTQASISSDESESLNKMNIAVLATGSLKYHVKKLRNSIVEKEIAMSRLL